MKYYNLKKILKHNATYNMIIGERSNGKTTAVLTHGLEHYSETGGQMAIIRRWREDFRAQRAASLFESLVKRGEIDRITGGVWQSVSYISSRWYFNRYDSEIEKTIVDENPFAYAFALSEMEHEKGSAYPNIDTVIFDEFIARSYLPDEFILFQNTLSTIIRTERTDVKIFMCGNTINKYCPYFSEMGLTHVKDMQQGQIDVYSYGTMGGTVAVEFSDSPAKTKPSDIYFTFDNPKLSMITGNGSVWELSVYPHLPRDYAPKDIIFTYFIIFSGDILQCEIINIDGVHFTYVHRKTTPIKHPDKDLIFTPDYDPRPNWQRRIMQDNTRFGGALYSYFINDKVYYQDNETGEIMRNYLEWCKQ